MKNIFFKTFSFCYFEKHKISALTFLFFAVSAFLSCGKNTVLEESYTMTNLSGCDAEVTLKIDGKRRIEFFPWDDTKKRTFTFSKTLYASMDFNPPQPCYISGKSTDTVIKKAEGINVKLVNNLPRAVTVSCIDFNLSAEEAAKFSKRLIFENTKVEAASDTSTLTLHFYKLILEPSWCSNVKIFTDDTNAKAKLIYDKKSKTFSIIIENK